MSTLASLKKIFSRKAARRSSALGLNPAREWIIGLVVAFLLLALGAAYASFSFRAHLNEGDVVSISEDGVIVYQKELVREVLEHYQSRAAEFESLRGESGVPESIPQTEVPESALIFDEGSLGAE